MLSLLSNKKSTKPSTMKLGRIAFSVLFLFVLMANASAQRWDGRWTGEMITPEGNVEILFEFQTDGRTLSGAAATPAGVIPLTNGVVDGQQISFVLTIEQFSIPHSGYYSRGQIILNTEFEGETGQIILSRVDN